MTKTERAGIAKLSAEALIEGFVTEAKLGDPTMLLSTKKMNEHGARSRAYADEIITRGGASSLVTLLDASDDWVSYSAAESLVMHDVSKDSALAALDRIADKRSGTASDSADIGRNMVRYGNPAGDPIEVEKRLAVIRAREG